MEFKWHSCYSSHSNGLYVMVKVKLDIPRKLHRNWHWSPVVGSHPWGKLCRQDRHFSPLPASLWFFFFFFFFLLLSSSCFFKSEVSALGTPGTNASSQLLEQSRALRQVSVSKSPKSLNSLSTCITCGWCFSWVVRHSNRILYFVKVFYQWSLARLCTAWQKSYCCREHWKCGHLCDLGMVWASQTSGSQSSEKVRKRFQCCVTEGSKT